MTSTLRPGLPALDRSWIAVTTAAAGAAGACVIVQPRAGLAALLLLAAVITGALVPTRYIVAGVLVYLPFQDFVLSHAPDAAVLPARYGPELVVYAIALVLLLARAAALAQPGARILGAIALVVALWSLSALWNDVALTTIAAGARSEFRFVPLIVVAMLSTTVLADARFYARVLISVALVESGIALAEAVGGQTVRAFFAPSYQLVVEGTVVGSAETPLGSIFGTFSHRNLLGAFLAVAGIVLAAAGAKELGVSRRVAIASWLVIVAGIMAAVSREGMIAVLAGTALVLSLRHRTPALRIVAIVGASAVLALLLLHPVRAATGPHGVSSWSRWGDVVSSRGWSATPTENLRLYYLADTSKFVAREAPVTGFGLGTVSDPRVVQAGQSPLELYPAGQLTEHTGLYLDGNWTVLLLEVGFGGMALLGLLFAYLSFVGIKASAAGAWIGSALTGLVLATVLLGFFAPIMQTRAPNMVLWLFAGLVAAWMSSQARTLSRPRPSEAGGEDH